MTFCYEPDCHLDNLSNFKNFLSPIFSGQSTIYNLELKHDNFKQALYVRVYCVSGKITVHGMQVNSIDELAEYLIVQMNDHFQKENTK